jgi:DNA-binding transcriptional ArsR family regulator
MNTEGRVEGDDRSATGVTQDTAFSVLSNRRRRQVLRTLRDAPGGSDVRELSRRLAAWENDVSPDAVTYRQRKRVYTSLHQTHLPALADAGVVDYDSDRGTVALTDRAAELDAYLDTGDDRAVPWSWDRLYLAVGVVGTAGTVAAAAGLAPPLVVAGGVSLAVTAAAGLQSYLHRVAADGAPRPEPDD